MTENNLIPNYTIKRVELLNGTSLTSNNKKITLNPDDFWDVKNVPPRISPDAFSGLTRIVKYIEKDTEADPCAILINLLVSFGNIAGRNSYYEVESTRHYPNLYAVLVGESSKARKGTSWSIIKKICEGIDINWKKSNIKSGLSSGEGFKYNVRDERSEINDKGKEILVDQGIKDKRLLIYEAEFANALKVAARPGNTLSSSIRDAWDTGNLSTLTKNDPIVATDAHISILGHITVEELQKYLIKTEAANGYANRFLWVFVKRANILPFGGNLPYEDLPYKEFKDAINFSNKQNQIKMDMDARGFWTLIYPKLSESTNGIIGAITSRAEAQTIRLALIYALLDCAIEIKQVHLQAALAVWNYCEASAKYIFKEKFSNDIARVIVQNLKDNPGRLFTKTELHKVFKNNKTSTEMNDAIRELIDLNLINQIIRRTNGRSVTSYELNELNEKNCNL